MKGHPTVTSVQVISDYTVRLEFSDGLVREVDLSDRLTGPVFGPLKDPEYFAKVRVDPDGGTIVWPNGADICPEILHGDYEPERRRD